jgi:SAM-dependent methyltransferase
MNHAIYPTCAICKSTDVTLQYKKKYVDQSQNRSFNIAHCNVCGLRFNYPRLSTADIADLYQNNYYFFDRDDTLEFNRIQKMYQRTIAVAKNHIPSKRVLEIGSAKGYLLSLLKSLDWEIQGIEISEAASHYASETLNVPTFTGSLEDALLSKSVGRYPCVLVIDVLEHVPDPIGFINKLGSVVENNGILIIDTPNGNSKNIELLGSKWDGFNPFHINIFTIDLVRKTLIEEGYTVLYQFSYNNSLTPKSNSFQKNDYYSLFRSLLYKAHILTPLRTIFHRFFRKSSSSDTTVEELLENASKSIAMQKSYFETADAQDVLSEKNKGDNFILIVKKN